jgi:hypothetical protein
VDAQKCGDRSMRTVRRTGWIILVISSCLAWLWLNTLLAGGFNERLVLDNSRSRDSVQFVSNSNWSVEENIKRETQWSLQFLEENAMERIRSVISSAKKHVITYAQGCCQEVKQRLCKTAFEAGGLESSKGDDCRFFSEDDLKLEFIKRNARHFEEKAGAGLWVWKPKIILDTLNAADEGDYVIYADAGIYFKQKIDIVLEFMERHPEFQEILFFSVGIPQKHYCKRDAFIRTGCDEPKCYEAMQIDASCSVPQECFRVEIGD